MGRPRRARRPRPEREREHWGVKWRLKRKRPKFGDYLHIGLSGAGRPGRVRARALHTFFPLSVRPVAGLSSIMGHQTLNSSFDGERERQRELDRLKGDSKREQYSISGCGASFQRGWRREKSTSPSHGRSPAAATADAAARRRYHLNPPTAAAAITAI